MSVDTKGAAREASSRDRESPISASLRARVSLAPSPQNPTRVSSSSFRSFMRATIYCFCSGVVLAYTLQCVIISRNSWERRAFSGLRDFVYFLKIS